MYSYTNPLTSPWMTEGKEEVDIIAELEDRIDCMEELELISA